MNQRTANASWLTMLKDVMERGSESKPRDMRIKEILGYHSVVDMSHPVVSSIERNIRRKFLAGEAHWILSGDNKVATISPYNARIADFSDDGRYFNGAYGPRVVEQLSYVVDTLVKDHDSRQAVMTIWRQNPRPSKDVPCTVAIQWFLRKRKSMKDDGSDLEASDEIHCVDTMRSSDCWLGWPYDVFNFTMLTALIALLYYERTKIRVDLGKLHMQCGSQHAYDRNWEEINNILYGMTGERFLSHGGDHLDYVPCVPYEGLDLTEFETADELMDHLVCVRSGIRGKSKFMKEFLPR